MNNLFLKIAFVFVLFSCAEGDIEIPIAVTQDLPSGSVVSIQTLRNSLDQNAENPIFSFTTPNQFIEGYVNSSDKEGNFFKKLIIQDHYKSPTAAITILIDERALYQRFPVGTKIKVRLEGLSIGFKSGVLHLGVLKETEIDAIDFSIIDNHIFRTDSKETIMPLNLLITEITKSHELLYVSFSDMQFNTNLLTPINKTFAGQAADNFDGLRIMEQCTSNAELVLSSSVFSTFKNIELPEGKGQVSGVLSKDFRGDFYVLKMNGINEIDLTGNDRCTTDYFQCDLEEGEGEKNIVFKEDFELITNEAKLEPLGWINVNVTGDEKRWQDRKVTNVDNRTLTISAFNSNLRPLEAWLITPEIDVSKLNNPVFSVRVRTRFNNGNALKIWVTNSFTNDPLTTKWEELPLKIPVSSSNFSTLNQSLSCLQGVVRIAFQYRGFDPVITSTYEIDDIFVYENK